MHTTLADAGSVAAGVVQAGAVLTAPGRPLRHYLIARFEWLDAYRVFWFPAHGDSAGDGGILMFDETEVVNHRSVMFEKDDTIVGVLAMIEEAGLEDADDYRIAWQLWQQTSPMREDPIERARDTLVEHHAE